MFPRPLSMVDDWSIVLARRYSLASFHSSCPHVRTLGQSRASSLIPTSPSSIQQLYKQVKSRNSRNSRNMPKFSTHFPFIKSGKPRTPGATRGNTPAPDNPAPASTASGGAATPAVVAPQVSPSPAVNVAPPTSADPQANVAAPVNTAESQDVPRQIATDDPAKAVASLLTLGATYVNSPEPGDATGNIAAANVAMQGAKPQANTSLPAIIAPSVGTEPQASTSAPISVAQRTGDSHVNMTDLTREAVREGSTRDVRPVTAAQAAPTPQINVEAEIGKEDQKQVYVAP